MKQQDNYCKKRFHVYPGSHTLQHSQEAVEKLKAEGLTNVDALQIDVSDDASVTAARVTIVQKTDVLDVLINNAGITGGMPRSALAATFDQC